MKYLLLNMKSLLIISTFFLAGGLSAQSDLPSIDSLDSGWNTASILPDWQEYGVEGV